MSGSRFELWLATTATLIVLAGPSHPVFAGPTTDVDISAAVPMPEPAGLPPPSIADLATVTTDSPTGAMSPVRSLPARSASSPAADAAAPVTAAPVAAAPAAAPSAKSATLPADQETAAPVVAAPAVVPAAESSAPVAEAPPLTPDQKVAEKIHELFGTRADRILDRKYKAAVEAFYSARAYAPLWVEDGVESRHAKSVASYLAGVDADGLDPADYPVPSFANTDPAAMAEAELKLTASVMTYARHAQTGRVHYSRVSNDILYNLVYPEPPEVLGKMADAKNVREALDSFNPPHEAYKALKAKLAEARGGRGGGGSNRISTGQSLKIGMNDPRVPMLRERFGVAGGDDNTIYDKALAEAVKKYQQQRGLQATGVFTNALVDALNGPRRDRDADVIIANMERWRWLPRDLGKAYVMVNIPEYVLRVMDHGSMVWTTRVVVGQPGEKATPLLTETMKYITVNPTWNVPPSIINNEYLPAFAQDPTVLDRMGLKMERNRDGTIHIYQPPGAGNALGRIRFNFPNKFSVYQHDTPDKYMFAHEKRAYSHGCMRVQNPDKYAEVLLHIANPRDGYTADRIRNMYGTGERDIQLQYQIPVHLTYQTATVDENGHLVIREDIYGRDARLLAALKGEDRRMADTPVERREAGIGGVRRQVQMMQRPTNGFFFGLFR
jgi:murein L,D-transpeptidase YcbB/YkuD